MNIWQSAGSHTAEVKETAGNHYPRKWQPSRHPEDKNAFKRHSRECKKRYIYKH